MHFLVDYDFERVHRYRAAWTRYLFWGKEEPTRSDWGEVMPATSSLLFAVTLDQGLLFYLGVIGLASWLSRHGRRELLWGCAAHCRICAVDHELLPLHLGSRPGTG